MSSYTLLLCPCCQDYFLLDYVRAPGKVGAVPRGLIVCTYNNREGSDESSSKAFTTLSNPEQ